MRSLAREVATGLCYLLILVVGVGILLGGAAMAIAEWLHMLVYWLEGLLHVLQGTSNYELIEASMGAAQQKWACRPSCSFTGKVLTLALCGSAFWPIVMGAWIYTGEWPHQH